MEKFGNFFDKIFNFIDKLINKLKNKKLIYYILFALILFFVSYYNMKDKVINNNASSNYNTKFLIYSSIVTIISIILIYFINKKKDIKIHIVFLILSLVLGITYIFAIPLYAQSDEPAHYLKAYSVAMGKFEANAKYNNTFSYPKVVKDSIYYNSNSKKWREYKTYDDMKKIRNMNPKYDKNQFIGLKDSAANYPSILYLPQAFGMKIGMVLNLNSYWVGILGIITNLLFCTLVLTLALKWLPYKKNAALVLLLSPVVLSYNAAFSIDGEILCNTFLFLSLILKLRKEKRNITLKESILLIILSILIGIAKFAYLPIVALILLLPKECFKNSSTKKYLYSILVIIIGCISMYIYLLMMNTKMTSSTSSYTNAWIYHSPVRLIYVFLNDAFVNGYDYLINIFAGHYLCHGQVSPVQIISFTYLLFFFISLFSEEGIKLRNYEKLLISLIILIIWFLLFLAMYLANTTFNSSVSNGVQGRYFIPLVIPFALLFNNKKFNISKENIMSISILLNLSIVLTMMVKFMFFI